MVDARLWWGRSWSIMWRVEIRERALPTAFIVSAVGCALSCCVVGAPLGLVGVVLAHRDQVRGRSDRFTVPAIIAGWMAVLLGVAVIFGARWFQSAFGGLDLGS
jgi:sulfite exporter TauE/SafE